MKFNVSFRRTTASRLPSVQMLRREKHAVFELILDSSLRDLVVTVTSPLSSLQG